MATRQEKNWCVGEVAWFAKLHYDTIQWHEEVIERDCDSPVETIRWYHIEGKLRPCLILEIEHDHFLVWCATTKKKAARSYIPLEGVHGLKSRGFLELDHEAIRWIHRNLADGWIGPQDREANGHVMEELQLLMHRAPKRPRQRYET